MHLLQKIIIFICARVVGYKLLGHEAATHLSIIFYHLVADFKLMQKGNEPLQVMVCHVFLSHYNNLIVNKDTKMNEMLNIVGENAMSLSTRQTLRLKIKRTVQQSRSRAVRGIHFSEYRFPHSDYKLLSSENQFSDNAEVCGVVVGEAPEHELGEAVLKVVFTVDHNLNGKILLTRLYT